MEKLPKYRIYSSLLDKYQSLLNYEQEADEPWNKWSEKKVAEYIEQHNAQNGADDSKGEFVVPEVGDYIFTSDQMYEKIERELIDSINRIPHEPSEAASRGTALNEIVDCLIKHKPCTSKEMSVEVLRTPDSRPFAVRALIDGFTFDFDVNLCQQLKDMLRGSICQYFINADVDTKYGVVQLYGYLDYWQRNHVIDLKTTSSYSFGKYERKWQRYVYPYCCIESGLVEANDIEDFTYLAVQLGRGKIIYGNIYPEVYTYNHEVCKKKLREQIESFIGWLESVRPLITDNKIFNQITED